MQLKYFLECVEQRISQALAWNIDDSQYPQPQLAAAAEHLCKAQGAKRARPKLAYYFGISIDSDLDLLADVAVTAEFIHGASLLHDDVIDDGKIRRGNPTVNVVWDNLTAVLAGDLLLSESIKGLRRCPRVIAQEALDIVSEMTRATMLESHLRGSTSINKQQWIYIARGKTASMFRWCGRSAAFLGGSPEAAEHFRLFGDHFGIAFQMAEKEISDIDLYTKDKRHPSKAGTYLMAAVIYSSVYNVSPIGNAYDYGLDKQIQERLQVIAWKAVNKYFGRS